MIPLCVDLDGTLVHTDVLHESLILLLKQKPWLALHVPYWALTGKSQFKQQIARRMTMDVSTLPYRQDLLTWLSAERAAGRPIYLVTASDERFANDIARHLGFFTGVWGSNGTVNLSGRRKRELLVQEFGERGFDYAGNAPIDMEIWRHSANAVVAGPNRKLVDAARNVAPVAAVFPERGIRLGALIRALRVWQWSKNLLVFGVLLTSHRLLDTGLWTRALQAFLALSFFASAVYVVNDLLDLESDRTHSLKRRRPFAAGELPVALGALLVPVLLLAAVAAGWTLTPEAWVLLALYPAIALTYSFFLKQMLLVDVFTLALLYSLRVLLGGAATGQQCSSWLMGFSFFLFLSLALGKRASELENRRALDQLPGRAYFSSDLREVHIFGVASAFASVMVLALYIHSAEVMRLYREPNWLWAAAIALMFWVCRLWLIASRGQLNEDPVAFAIKDRVTYVVGVLVIAAVFLAARTTLAIPGMMR